MEFNKLFKPEILTLYRVKDTFEDRYDFLRLDKNERVLPFPQEQLQNFFLSLESEDLSGYPELDPLYRKLAKFLNINNEQLYLAAGSDLAIKSIFESCIQAGDNIILPLPGYAMYRVYASMFGAETLTVPYGNDQTLDVEKMLSLVTDHTKFFVLENPSGSMDYRPTKDILEHCAMELEKKNIFFLMDEAYYYVENEKASSTELIQKFKNVILTQTLSKAHGLAGLRIGFLAGDKEVMRYISRVRPMHEMTSISAKAAHWVLDHPSLLSEYQSSIREAKAYCKKELEKLDCKCLETHANFMLISFPKKDTVRLLREKNKILLKNAPEKGPLKGWSRMTVGSLEDSKKFIEAVRSL